MKIFAVIVTYNSNKWIRRCLLSVLESDIQLTPLIIDNDSTDNSIETIEKEFESIQIIKLTKNLGFGRANNIGISHALKNGAETVLLLNQDVYLNHSTISLLMPFYDLNSILCPIQISNNAEKLDHNFKINLISELRGNQLIDNLIITRGNSDYVDVEFTNAACWLIPKEVLLKVGGFNPVFFHYGEDLEYTYRLQFHKVKIKVVIQSTVIHDRQFHGNFKAFKKNGFKREVLLSLSNPNINSVERFFQLSKSFLILNRLLIKGEIKDYSKEIFQLLSLFFLFGVIIRNKTQAKIEQANWLNL